MNIQLKRYSAIVTLSMLLFQILIPIHVSAASNDLVYPIKEISKLECRFQDFDTLSSNCKEQLPILKTKDYNKYAKQNGWYNDFTRLYTVLWGSSYKYGWDVWNGGHQGTDIATAKGTPVYSIADGTVITSATDIGWGKHISIEHTINGKKVISNYAHLSEIDTKKWAKVRAGQKIGEVWSTGNSTGNHLHFQIDLPSSFHPYYYDWNACPYSYYEITEKGVCFDELTRNTFDPLAFLESNGAILDDIVTTTVTKQVSQNTNSNVVFQDIFDTTVYHGYGTTNDVKQVQLLYKELGYYKWSINGNYSDVEESVIKYQLASGVLNNRTEDGAGWFGPKTRKQTEKDYNDYLASGKITRKVSEESSVVKSNVQKIETVSRANLLTREEIEAREVDDFLRDNTVEVKNTFNYIEVGDTKSSTLSITTKRGRWYKGNTPGSVTFEYDASEISVFPKSFFNFVDGNRDIHVTGLKAWNTTLKVKIGEKVIKTYSVTVWGVWVTPWVSSASIYTPKDVTLGSTNTAIVLMKDSFGNKLVRTEYTWDFTLDSSDAVEYCIKKWALSEIRSVYKRKCRDDEFTNTLSFDYTDSVGGLILFDYRVMEDDNLNLKLSKSWKTLESQSINVTLPKGLQKWYPYYNEVVSTLKSWVSDIQNNGYFHQDKWLTKLDAAKWIENAFSWDETVLRAQKIKSTFDTLTRWEFLELVEWYTWKYSDSDNETNKYKDLEGEEERKVVSLLGTNYTWKDQFWEWYFQPGKTITRWEATYMIEELLDRTQNTSVARR